MNSLTAIRPQPAALLFGDDCDDRKKRRKKIGIFLGILGMAGAGCLAADAFQKRSVAKQEQQQQQQQYNPAEYPGHTPDISDIFR